jgi:signal transduction histidine kinase
MPLQPSDAQASRVDISVATSNGGLLLSIRDEGAGGANPRHGSGLVGLRDRVEALGGTMRLDSAADSGTSLVVTLPLEVPVEAAPDAPVEETLSAAE